MSEMDYKQKIEEGKKLMKNLSYDEQDELFEKFIKENNCKVKGGSKNGRK